METIERLDRLQLHYRIDIRKIVRLLVENPGKLTLEALEQQASLFNCGYAEEEVVKQILKG